MKLQHLKENEMMISNIPQYKSQNNLVHRYVEVDLMMVGVILRAIYSSFS